MIPLKVITEYSLLKSLIKVKDLINFLNENKIDTCGICDNELFGVMEFYFECKNNNIKPIIGLEININNYIVYLYPKNYDGYKKLLKINTLKLKNELNKDNIIDNNIFIVLPYKSIELYEILSNKDNIYISYENEREKLSALLITKNILYINNIRCFKKEDIKYLEYLNKINEFEYNENEYFKLNITTEDEIYLKKFSDLINIEIPLNNKFIPKYNSKINSYEFLKSLSLKGLNKRLNGNIPSIYINRLKEELNIINKMGFVDYFLIVYDYVLYAKKSHILVGPGRGSAVSSLVSYSIGITDIDPLKYDLMFSRFLNPYRSKMPDIDIDFEDTKRGNVINYVKEKYGYECVASGITFNSYKAKLILRDMAKIMNINNNLFEKFIKLINSNLNLKDNYQNIDIQKYLKLYPELKELYNVCYHLENLKKNISTHAAGVVICDRNLDDIIPIYIDNNEIKTGLSMDYLEKLGLLKMDFLAIRNLTIIGNIISKIKNFDLNNINYEDDKVYELFRNANTNDIFQFSSNYAKKNLLKLKVKNFNELIIATALNRPGPGMEIDNYIKNLNTNKYDVHPDLKDILDSTKGIIIFQEQVMKILQTVGGYSEYEADNIRNAISKKKIDIIEKEEKKFYERALKKYDRDFVIDIFNKIKKFAEYGFNKAHSVSYAKISYIEAYLKVYYPLEFNITLLENTSDKNERKRLINELRNENIKILKPNINISTDKFIYKNGSLLLPYVMIRNLNMSFIKDVLDKKEDKFNDIYDFFIKCYDILNEKNYITLVKSGILDIFKINHQTLIKNYETLYNYAELNDNNLTKPLLKEYDEYSDDILRNDENECYGFYIGNHPSSKYGNVIKIKDITKYLFKNINMALLVEKITVIKTKNKEDMAFILTSDETGNIEVILFPENYQKYHNLKVNDLILINGKPVKRYDKYNINLNSIKMINNIEWPK